jgi:hypothetical protein
LHVVYDKIGFEQLIKIAFILYNLSIVTFLLSLQLIEEVVDLVSKLNLLRAGQTLLESKEVGKGRGFTVYGLPMMRVDIEACLAVFQGILE